MGMAISHKKMTKIERNFPFVERTRALEARSLHAQSASCWFYFDADRYSRGTDTKGSRAKNLTIHRRLRPVYAAPGQGAPVCAVRSADNKSQHHKSKRSSGNFGTRE